MHLTGINTPLSYRNLNHKDMVKKLTIECQKNNSYCNLQISCNKKI